MYTIVLYVLIRLCDLEVTLDIQNEIVEIHSINTCQLPKQVTVKVFLFLLI